MSGMSEPPEPTDTPMTATYVRPDGAVVTVDLSQVWAQLVPISSEQPAYTAESVEAALDLALQMAVGSVEVYQPLLLKAVQLLDQLDRQAAGPDYSGTPFENEVRTTILALQFLTGWQGDHDHRLVD
jgi:hypothetical protein